MIENGRAEFLRSAVGAQPPVRHTVVDGVSIAYSDSGGDGPALVCLHAIGHGARDFEELSRRLHDRLRVIAIDFPGQGNSGPDEQPASATRYTFLLKGFLRELKTGPVVLLGNSIGGAAAIRYALEEPGQVRGLVLCNSGALVTPGPLDRLFIAAFAKFFAAGRRRAGWFPWAFERYYRRILRQPPALAQRDRIVRSAYEIAPILEQAWLSFAKPEEDLRARLSEVRCPVLAAWAKDDIIIQWRTNRPALARFPNCQIELFAGGHAAFLEDPDRFDTAIRRFLDSVLEASAG